MRRKLQGGKLSAASPGRQSPPIGCDYTNLLATAVGATHGVTEKELDKLTPRLESYHQEMVEERERDLQAFRNLPYDTRAVKEVTQLADRLSKRFENLVVLGIGGSALGNIALHSALRHPYYNELPREVRKRPGLYVMDNVDPVRLAGLFDLIDVKQTLFNVITKSGSTAETVSQLLIVREMLGKELGDSYVEHIVATTDPGSGPLRRLAEEEGWSSFAIPPGVGGRFSVLSPVGLFSAAMTGIDVEALLAGARAMDKRCRGGGPGKSCLYGRGAELPALCEKGQAHTGDDALLPCLEGFGGLVQAALGGKPG
jgi:glucose-6-phosphate isomerase